MGGVGLRPKCEMRNAECGMRNYAGKQFQRAIVLPRRKLRHATMIFKEWLFVRKVISQARSQ